MCSFPTLFEATALAVDDASVPSQRGSYKVIGSLHKHFVKKVLVTQNAGRKQGGSELLHSLLPGNCSRILEREWKSLVCFMRHAFNYGCLRALLEQQRVQPRYSYN